MVAWAAASEPSSMWQRYQSNTKPVLKSCFAAPDTWARSGSLRLEKARSRAIPSLEASR